MKHEKIEPAWYARTVADTLADLEADANGLSAKEAGNRLTRYGPNTLPVAAGKSVFVRLLAQFNNLLIFVLLGAAVISAMLGHAIDTSVILAVVILNAVIGFVQEGRAERALEAIRSMISPRVSILRDGRRVTLDAAEIVPGDILLLEAGGRVGADVRLMKARNLHIDEAALTGESVPVEKGTDAVDPNVPLGDRTSMAYAGTLVTSGLGTGVVVATGLSSELGRVSALLGRVQELQTPLIRQMNGFARLLTFVTLALSAVTFAFATLVRDYRLDEAFMTVVGMAVAAIPEGLPAVMTITLAIGVQRMAARNAIIRELPAVETLGSVSTICSDKTGTFTRNEMTVMKVVLSDRAIDVSGSGYTPEGGFSVGDRKIDPAKEKALLQFTRTALLCSDAALRHADGNGWTIDGDPMEAALVVLAVKAGQDQDELREEFPRLDEIPFEAEHRYMATLHHAKTGPAIACVKGAPERVLEMCDREATTSGPATMQTAYWEDEIEQLGRQGYRVLAVASREIAATTRDLAPADVERGLTLQGVVGLIDPPRPEAVSAVAECQSAGIVVKMITGDHATTASAIAEKLGIGSADVVATGKELDGLNQAALRRVASVTGVFARTSPENKLRLVEAMQAEGAVIAMTGDGVNDAPALKRADVGVAMGVNGTEAAKEASDVVLADDNFASIVAAVREGRTVYDNLTKVIGWTLPTSGGETLIIMAAILFGLTVPITPVQILWINMVTAVALGLVLAFEPAEPDIMKRAPRDADTPLLSGELLWRIVFVCFLFAIGGFGLFAWAQQNGASLEEARTIVVNAIVVMEIFYLFSVRYLHSTSFTWQGVLGTPAVLIGVGTTVLAQIAFTYLPAMHVLFQTRPVSIAEGAVIIGTGVVFFVIMEVEKRLRRHVISLGWFVFRAKPA